MRRRMSFRWRSSKVAYPGRSDSLSARAKANRTSGDISLLITVSVTTALAARHHPRLVPGPDRCIGSWSEAGRVGPGDRGPRSQLRGVRGAEVEHDAGMVLPREKRGKSSLTMSAGKSGTFLSPRDLRSTE